MGKPLRLCVVGTDTGAGKTIVTAALARAARGLGLAPVAFKPLQTGCPRDSEGFLRAPDVEVYREASPEAALPPLVLLEDASSPHLAARREGVSLSAAALASCVEDRLRSLSADLVFIEGAGGLMTPLNDSETLLDLFSLLGASFILAAPNRLGVLNHALLSAAALRARGLHWLGFILTRPSAGDDSDLDRRIRADNGEAISRMAALPYLADMPFIEELQSPCPDVRAKGWDRAAQAVEGAVRTAGRRFDGRLTSEQLLRFDRDHVWHPYASAVRPVRVREAVGTEKARIRLRGGEDLVDGMASWWCAIHGYRHPALMRALHEQAGRMPHVMFGGLTHEPAVELARKLLAIAPPGLDRVFFADSGSVAVEVAIKMALQYQRACGHPERTRLLTVRGGYHGDTLAAMSVCDPQNGLHANFAGLLPRQIFAPRPDCRFDRDYDPAPAEALADVLGRHAGQVAALILEPVLQGAGGMWIYHPDYLSRASELCRENGCLLILDEIATGFGRTGRMFASEWSGITPDILCLGKALTGGVMSLAATLASEAVAEGLSRRGGVLMHGPTFMGNPLACAVAGASLDLLSASAWKADVDRIERTLRLGLEPCRGLPGIADVRVLGAVGVLETQGPVAVEKLQDYFVRQGVWLRPFGRLIYAMPPYVISDGELGLIVRAMRGAAEEKQWE
ncbi:MAG: adenosylmethionine--8-amino-7-oxononanoate transaminase [Deltaproteobacteria bacterium]|nr:adenosylmethionine--8-amino-7-oxononanoate transaminase [Deltaproteobacteria bacterium]